MVNYCCKCNKPISEEVFKFSTKKYSRPLCIEHQPNQTKKYYPSKPEPTPEAKKLGELLKKYG